MRSLEKPERFGGCYTLVERLAVGGMAEVYRARRDASAGFEKEVVIKRLKPEFISDATALPMLLENETGICMITWRAEKSDSASSARLR